MFVNKIHTKDMGNSPDEVGLEYWQNRIFSVVTAILIICGGPLQLYGAYLFYIEGEPLDAFGAMLIFSFIALISTRKSISLRKRKIYTVLGIYFLGVLLMVHTGIWGAGMAFTSFSLILSACLLDRNQIYKLIVVNLIVFTALSIMLYNGDFNGTPMESYRSVWFMNAISAQTGAILLIIILNKIYSGLEKQAMQIRESQDLLAASEARQRAMIANISDVIAIINERGFLEHISPNVEQKCGWGVEDFSDKPIWDKFHLEDRTYLQNEIEALCKKDGAAMKMEVRCLTRDRYIVNAEITAVNLIKDINIKGILINFHDITEHKKREEEILYLNYHDVLTGLGNRRFYDEHKSRLDTEGRLPLSVIVGDINGLKLINDSLGHAEGDKLLKNISQILENNCGKDDILARVGGDEFIMLLPGIGNEEANRIIKKIKLACEEYNQKVSSELYYTNISLGYATRTSVSESFDSVKKIAEDYMYKRKLLEDRSLHSAIVASMKTTLHAKSQETEEHAQRLVKLSRAIGRVIGLTDHQFDELELLASLHDIGKIGIDDQILNKPGKLTEAEWAEMKKHTEIGYRIAMPSPELIPIAEYILTHHERFDGRGYPQGLSGENIPLLSRIVAVADAYDAMTEDRSYRKGMSKEAAIAEIVRNSGTQFDPDVVKIFVEIIERGDG